MTSGMIAATSGTPTSVAAAEINVAGLTKATIPTPALVVDLDAFEANVQFGDLTLGKRHHWDPGELQVLEQRRNVSLIAADPVER
jgi:hypothetical protein